MKSKLIKTLVATIVILLSTSFWMSAEAARRITLRKDKPLEEQLKKENVVYCIKSDFDLKGQTVTIPKGSTLKFKKGVLSNGALVGQETMIVTGKQTRFGKNLVIRGTWNVENAYSEWFGPKGDGTDDTDALTAFFNFPAEKKTLKRGEYGVNELQCPRMKNCEIYAYGATLKYLRTDLDNIPGDHVVLANYMGKIRYDSELNGYLRIYGLTIDGNSQNFVYDRQPEKQTSIIDHHTLRFVLTDEVVLKDCTFKNSFMTAVILDICKKSVIDRCSIINSGESVSYKPVGMWYTWEGVCVMDKVYTNKGWREDLCEQCVVKDSYFENIGGSFASANCKVFECYGNTVRDNRGYAFELSRVYNDRVVDIHDNEFYGVGSAAIDMTHFQIPDNTINTVKMYNNKYHNLGYDSHRTQPCSKAFLMIYRNKEGIGTGVLEVTIKNNLFELAQTASQGLIRCDKFVFEGNTVKGFNGYQSSALFFCGNDEGLGSYYIHDNTLNFEGGALSIIRSPKYLEVSGNRIKTSKSNSIVWIQGTEESMKKAEYNIYNNEVNGPGAMVYVSSGPKELKMYDNKSESIEIGILRSSSEVPVRCVFENNSFKKVSGTQRNITITNLAK